MSKDETVYVHHMLEQARHLVEGRTRVDYDADRALRLALVHLIQIIGEAARRVKDPFRALAPEVRWSAIVGMRNKIVHDYMTVDEELVWQVVDRDLPVLVPQLEELIGKLPPPTD